MAGETILVCDDDPLVAEAYRSMLEVGGYDRVVVVTDPRELVSAVSAESVSVLLLDLIMPHVSGRELLERLAGEHPQLPVIILTLEDRVDVAVECMKLGAYDYMTKPVEANRLLTSIAHALQVRSLHREVQALSSKEARLDHPEAFAGILTRDERMLQIFAYVEAVAPGGRAVLVSGESGTGKELVARAVHRLSGRDGRFVAVNVAGLDETMFSDTLFGHRKGAFTSAETARSGLIAQAERGTLFLDEIGDLDNPSQVKLLRLLQENEYYPLGSDVPQRSTARIVAATNADLARRQDEGSFRKDLYFRLVSHHVQLPPLRERFGDLPLLVDRFLAESAAELSRPQPGRPAGLERFLAGYSFPGNVRELQAIVADVVSRVSGRDVSLEDFTGHPSLKSIVPAAGTGRLSYVGAIPTLAEAEAFLMSEALEQTGGNQTAAARLLGVSQSTLSRRLAGS